MSKHVMAPAVAEATGQPRERVLGLADGISRASSIIGPLGAAALVVAIGAPLAIAVDAASFIVCSLIVVTLVPRSIGMATRHEEDDGLSYVGRLRSGASFMRRDGLLRSIAGMVAVTNLLDAALATVLIAVWARSHGGGAGLMGSVSAALGAGAVIGALVAASQGHRLPRRATFGWGFFLIGAPRFLVLALGPPLWVVLAVIFVGGLGAGTLNPILAAVELERIPEHLRGRVMSLLNSVAWALIPFGGLVGGILSDQLGITAALLICGALYFVATTLPALRPEWKSMDRRPASGAALAA
jgi:predicted MFS family arabinose efflux permease